MQEASNTTEPELSKEETIRQNMSILEAVLLGIQSPESDRSILATEKSGVSIVESRIEDTQLMNDAIRIVYNTFTGQITDISKQNFTDGKYSVFRTFLLRENEQTVPAEDRNGWRTILGKYRITLVYPGTLPTPQEYMEAISGDENPTDNERRIPVERIFFEDFQEAGLSLVGQEENWGRSEVVDNPTGDEVVLESIKRFNSKHGPLEIDKMTRRQPPKGNLN